MKFFKFLLKVLKIFDIHIKNLIFYIVKLLKDIKTLKKCLKIANNGKKMKNKIRRKFNFTLVFLLLEEFLEIKRQLDGSYSYIRIVICNIAKNTKISSLVHTYPFIIFIFFHFYIYSCKNFRNRKKRQEHCHYHSFLDRNLKIL